MRNGRSWGVLRHGLAALSFSCALASSSIAGTLAVSTSAEIISIQSISRFADASRSIQTLRYSVLDKHAGAPGYSTHLFPSNFSICQADWCAGGAATLAGIHGVPLTDAGRFDAPIRWQSSLNIAGSRVWSQFIKFSRTGINVRLPLN
jgi:hypothetical protein